MSARKRRGEDNAVLERLRNWPCCEWCGSSERRREPHHIWARGAGCPDDPRVIVALCRRCHDLLQNDPETEFIRGLLVCIAAVREARGLSFSHYLARAMEIRAAVWKWRKPA